MISTLRNPSKQLKVRLVLVITVLSIAVGILLAQTINMIFIVLGAVALVALWLWISHDITRGILLILILEPFNELQRIPQYPSLDLVKVVGFVTFFIWLHKTAVLKTNVKLYPTGKLFLALLASLFISSLNATFLDNSLSAWLTLLSYFLLSLVVLNEMKSEGNVAIVLKSYVLVGGLIGFIAIAQYLTDSTLFPQLLGTAELSKGGLVTADFAGRVVGTATNPNAGALVPVLGIPVALALLLNEKVQGRRFLFVISLITMVAHIILSFSRSAWIALALSCITLFIFLKKDLPKIFPYVVVASALVLGFFFLYTEQVLTAVGSRLIQIATLGQDDPRRVALLSATIPFLREHWLLGVGLGGLNFETEMAIYTGFRITAHSSILAIVGGGGILSLVLYVLIFLHALRASLKARNLNLSERRTYLNAGVMASIIGWQIHGLFHSYHLWVIGWLLVAILIVNIESMRKPQNLNS